MPKRSEIVISRRTVDALSVEGADTVFWDRTLAGFGVRVYPSGRKTYVVQSRGPRGIRRVSLGHHGALSAERARKRAGAVIGRIKDGADTLAARAAAALRLVMLTGCRVGEVLTLRWDDVDAEAGELRLRDAKTGARMVPLSPDAAAVLAGVTRVRRNPWVFPGKKPGAHLSVLTKYWRRVRERAGVEDVRIHDLRHSFASRALALGESLSMIGQLLGHTDVGSTARYAHLTRDAERRAAARVGASLEADLLTARKTA